MNRKILVFKRQENTSYRRAEDGEIHQELKERKKHHFDVCNERCWGFDPTNISFFEEKVYCTIRETIGLKGAACNCSDNGLVNEKPFLNGFYNLSSSPSCLRMDLSFWY